MEQEISRLNKQLDHSRSSYVSLQKQYNEQCSTSTSPSHLPLFLTHPAPFVAVSEKYRDELRQREEQMRALRESASLQEVESLKYAKEQENYEARIVQLEADLSIAQQAHEQLDEQKHENMLLKETIDRMRFDMDEMRNAAVGGVVVGYGAPGSAPGSVSKSLGAEMLGKMTWLGEEEGREVGEVDGEEEQDDTEGEEEEEIQTIITRKKRVCFFLFFFSLLGGKMLMTCCRKSQAAQTHNRSKEENSKKPKIIRTVARNMILCSLRCRILHRRIRSLEFSLCRSARRLRTTCLPGCSPSRRNLGRRLRWRFRRTLLLF
jgi:hypothetical protein